MPEAMTYFEATSIVTNYLTAYFAIMDFGNLRPGQSVLIQSAAGTEYAFMFIFFW